MDLEIILIVVGLVILLVAGDVLVRGAVGLAAALKIPALLISLTIVAFGTSAPELVVTIQAVSNDSDGIALGNIIGSNIANILLVLGLPAIIYPISAHVPGLRRHLSVMLLATVMFIGVAYFFGEIDMRVGAVFFAVIFSYIGYIGFRARHGGDEPVLDDVDDYMESSGVSAKTIMFVLIGLIGLPLGAHLLVTNGEIVAASLGVRDEIIGLTIIAFGTSLPELATVSAAALHKKSDVAIGGVVGSNIFNLLAVGGAAGFAGAATFDPTSLHFDLPVMAAASVILAIFVLSKRDIGRVTGLIMFAGYCAFIYGVANIATG